MLTRIELRRDNELYENLTKESEKKIRDEKEQKYGILLISMKPGQRKRINGIHVSVSPKGFKINSGEYVPFNTALSMVM